MQPEAASYQKVSSLASASLGFGIQTEDLLEVFKPHRFSMVLKPPIYFSRNAATTQFEFNALRILKF